MVTLKSSTTYGFFVMEDLSNCITNNSPGSCTLASHTEGTAYINVAVIQQTQRTGVTKPVTWDIGSGEKETFTYGDEDEQYTVGTTIRTASATTNAIFTAEDKIWNFWKRHNRIGANAIYIVHRYSSGNTFEYFRGYGYSQYKYAPCLMRKPLVVYRPQDSPLLKTLTIQFDIVWS